MERIGYKEARALLRGPPKKSKFRNHSFYSDGIYWHSKREYKRWLELLCLEKGGEISELRRQVAFDLHTNGIKIGTYRADYVYRDKSGALVVEDVKSERKRGQSRSATATALYQRSKRHLRAEYGLDITEY